MTQQQQESRQEEVARVRSYLASQSMRRTPAEIVELISQAHHQFLEATNAIPNALFRTPPHTGEWSATDVLEHVHKVALMEERAFRSVIERNEQPPDISDVIEPAPANASREQVIADIEHIREQISTLVLAADPQAHLDLLWGHREFGRMNWREWLLFTRIHTLDHTRQIQTIGQALLKE